MRIAVFQPHLFPCLYYWNRMASVDTFVLLDDAQFTKKSEGGEALQNYTFVKAPDGQKKKVTLSVLHDGQRHSIIDKKLAPGAIKLLLLELERLYGNNLFGLDSNLWTLPNETTLGEFTCNWIEATKNTLGLPTKVIRNSQLMIGGEASEWMLNFCLQLRADTYVCGKAAYDQYLDKEAFRKAGIQVEVQNWKCPEYEQGKKPFIPNLSIIDAVCRLGWEKTKELIS